MENLNSNGISNSIHSERNNHINNNYKSDKENLDFLETEILQTEKNNENNIEKVFYSTKKRGIYIFLLSSFQIFIYYGFKGKFGDKFSSFLFTIKNFASKVINSEILTFRFKHIKNLFLVSLGIGISSFFLGLKFQRLFMRSKKENWLDDDSNLNSINKQNSLKIDKSNKTENHKSNFTNKSNYDNEHSLLNKPSKNTSNKKNKSYISKKSTKINDSKYRLYIKSPIKKSPNLNKYKNSTSSIILKLLNSERNINEKKTSFNYLGKFSRKFKEITITNASKKDYQTDDSDYSNIYEKDFLNSNDKRNKTFQEINSKKISFNKTINNDTTIFNDKSDLSLFKNNNENDSKLYFNAYRLCLNDSNRKFISQSSFKYLDKISEIEIAIDRYNLIENKEKIEQEKQFTSRSNYGNDEKAISARLPNIDNKPFIIEIACEQNNSILNKDIKIQREIEKDFIEKININSKTRILKEIKNNSKKRNLIIMDYTKPKF